MVVEDKKIKEAFYTPGGTYLNDGELELLFTIEKFFSVIEVAISQNVTNLSATYNVDYGYLEKVAINVVSKEVADNEIIHLIIDFQ